MSLNYKDLENLIPDEIREAIATHQSHKLAEAMTGLQDFSFGKIAEYMGTKMAFRRAKYRPIGEGIQAMLDLRG